MLKHYSIADTFGITAPATMKVEGFAATQNPYVLRAKALHFRKDHLTGCTGLFRFTEW